MDGVGLHRSDTGPLSPGDHTHHPREPPPASVRPTTKGLGNLSASSACGDWRLTLASVHSPGASLPGPFATRTSPALPAPAPWLHTPVEDREVRAEISERVRSRPGRLWFTCAPSFPNLTVCSRDDSRVKLSPEPCGSRASRRRRCLRAVATQSPSAGRQTNMRARRAKVAE